MPQQKISKRKMNSTEPTSSIIKRFIADRDIVKGSAVMYNAVLNQYFLWLHAKDLHRATVRRKHFIEWRKHLEQNHTQNTVYNYHNVIRMFYRWLNHNKRYEDITQGIRNSRRRDGFKYQHMSHEQLTAILNSIPKDTLKGKRDYAMINLMALRALRCVEITRIKVEDLFSRDGRWFMRVQAKAHKEKDQVIPISQRIFVPIQEYLNQLQPEADSAMFVSIAYRNKYGSINGKSINRIFKKYRDQAGINDEGITAHSLRHTAGILALKQGYDINDVRIFLRHRDISTTQIYLRTIEREKQINSNVASFMDNIIELNQDKKQNIVIKV